MLVLILEVVEKKAASFYNKSLPSIGERSCDIETEIAFCENIRISRNRKNRLRIRKKTKSEKKSDFFFTELVQEKEWPKKFWSELVSSNFKKMEVIIPALGLHEIDRAKSISGGESYDSCRYLNQEPDGELGECSAAVSVDTGLGTWLTRFQFPVSEFLGGQIQNLPSS